MPATPFQVRIQESKDHAWFNWCESSEKVPNKESTWQRAQSFTGKLWRLYCIKCKMLLCHWNRVFAVWTHFQKGVSFIVVKSSHTCISCGQKKVAGQNYFQHYLHWCQSQTSPKSDCQHRKIIAQELTEAQGHVRQDLALVFARCDHPKVYGFELWGSERDESWMGNKKQTALLRGSEARIILANEKTENAGNN